jgi:hypothetical protein
VSAPLPPTALARLLMPGSAGTGLVGVFGAYLTAWDAVTFANTVALGGVVWTNLRFINASLLSVGPVLMAATPASPIILGRLGEPTV